MKERRMVARVKVSVNQTVFTPDQKIYEVAERLAVNWKDRGKLG